MRDFGAEAQKAAEAHLAACQEAFWDYESGEMQGEEDGSPASAPFCNCDTCIVREVLYAGWPSLEKLAREEITERVRRRWLRMGEEQITDFNTFRGGYVSGLAWVLNVLAEQQVDPVGDHHQHQSSDGDQENR